MRQKDSDSERGAYTMHVHASLYWSTLYAHNNGIWARARNHNPDLPAWQQQLNYLSHHQLLFKLYRDRKQEPAAQSRSGTQALWHGCWCRDCEAKSSPTTFLEYVKQPVECFGWCRAGWYKCPLGCVHNKAILPTVHFWECIPSQSGSWPWAGTRVLQKVHKNGFKIYFCPLLMFFWNPCIFKKWYIDSINFERPSHYRWIPQISVPNWLFS